MCLQAAAGEDGEENTCRSRKLTRGPLQGERGKWMHHFPHFPSRLKTSVRLHLTCRCPLSSHNNPDAEPDVWHALRGAGLQGGAGLAHPHVGEACGGAEGGLQEPDAAPVEHAVHTELLHPTPPQGEGGEDGHCQRGRRQVEQSDKWGVNKNFSGWSRGVSRPTMQYKWFCWDTFS